MADFSGLVISALAVSFEIASTLYSYGKDVKGARKDIQNLSNELFGLIGVLEHLKSRCEQRFDDEVTLVDSSEFAGPRSSTDLSCLAMREGLADVAQGPHRENFRLVLSQTLEFLQELQQLLQIPRGRFAAAVNLMKWPLKQGDMVKHLKRLERVKTYFVLFLVTDEVDLSQRIVDEIGELRTMMQEASREQKFAKSRQEYGEILQWLSPVDPGPTRLSLSKLRAPGSGAWFTSTEAFKEWKGSSTSSTFWLNGITGAGKSTLMTAVVDTIVSSEEQLAYFYCSFSDDQTLQTQHILGSLLAQLCLPSQPLFEELRTLHADICAKTSGKPRRLEVDILSDLLVAQAERQRLYIVIDGINECGQPHEVLQALSYVAKSTSSIRLFLSSINEKGIEDYIRSMPGLFVETLRPKDIRRDVALLIQSTLNGHTRLKQLPPDLKDDIMYALSKGAEGMFRWVQCQLDALSRLRTPGAIRKALSSLPATLDKTYEEMLLRIDGDEDMDLTKSILQLLAFSLVPLTLHEVCEALQITPGMPYLDESKCLTHPKDILSICGSLLSYNETNGIIMLAHHSVKTYLTSDLQGKVSRFRLNEENAHHTIALHCLTYLSYDAFSQDFSQSLNMRLDGSVGCDFLEYAVQQWPHHFRESGTPSDELWTALRFFLLSGDYGRNNFLTWVQHLIPGSEYAQDTPPLYYAASFGLTTVVRYLLELGVDVERRGGRAGATPINIAAFRDHLDVVKLLLEHGADPLKPDIEADLDAIQWARYMEHWRVLRYFQSKGYVFVQAKRITNGKLEPVEGTGSWRLRTPATSHQEVTPQEIKPQGKDRETSNQPDDRMKGLPAENLDYQLISKSLGQ